MRRPSLPGILIAFVLATGCAKQPATVQTAAPAPTGTPSPTTPPTRPGPSSLTPPMTGPTTPLPTAPGSTSRPTPGDFVRVPDLAAAYFEFDRYDVGPAAAKVLDGNARWLQAHADQVMLIEGHCDERGTVEYNLVLGERRAKAAMNYLVSRGIAASRLTVVSYGEERPTCSNRHEGCWAKNRRASFLAKRR